MKKRNNKKGFTIVELVIVIAVIAILAAVLIPTFTGVTERAKKNAAMQNARNAWTEYMTENADKPGYEENICIKSNVDGKDYYFHVENGEFETKAVENHDSTTHAADTAMYEVSAEGKLKTV
ncbi:MAG: type II secretion system GspH family protein [Clostridiales bacterium]|nr:type II secretion system GspH family protein [Clostridiales bacterium]